MQLKNLQRRFQKAVKQPELFHCSRNSLKQPELFHRSLNSLKQPERLEFPDKARLARLARGPGSPGAT